MMLFDGDDMDYPPYSQPVTNFMDWRPKASENFPCMTTNSTPSLSVIRKVMQVTSQDFGPFLNSVNTPTLTSSDVDLDFRTCSCRLGYWIPCSHVLMVLREKKIPIEYYCNQWFLLENFKLTYDEFQLLT